MDFVITLGGMVIEFYASDFAIVISALAFIAWLRR